MANIFDYLIWRGDLPLSVSPFNEVDGAVFARLSYLPFELIMPCFRHHCGCRSGAYFAEHKKAGLSAQGKRCETA